MEQIKNNKTGSEPTEKRKVMSVIGEPPEAKGPKSPIETEESTPNEPLPITEKRQWYDFMKILETQKSTGSEERHPRMLVTVAMDCELVYTLDECRKLGFRGELLNAILRQFIETNIEEFAKYRTVKKSLLNKD